MDTRADPVLKRIAEPARTAPEKAHKLIFMTCYEGKMGIIAQCRPEAPGLENIRLI
jgi:hypothetical protein